MRRREKRKVVLLEKIVRTGLRAAGCERWDYRVIRCVQGVTVRRDLWVRGPCPALVEVPFSYFYFSLALYALVPFGRRCKRAMLHARTGRSGSGSGNGSGTKTSTSTRGSRRIRGR